MNPGKHFDEDERRTRLDMWGARIDELQARTRQANATARPELEEELSALRTQYTQLVAKLDELTANAEESRIGLVEALDAVYGEFERRIESTASRMKHALGKDSRSQT